MHLLIVFYQLQNPRRAYLFRLKHPSPVNQDIVKGIVVKPEIPGGGILSHAQLQGNIRLLKRILYPVKSPEFSADPCCQEIFPEKISQLGLKVRHMKPASV